jgi:aryl-alcohol dehydrogenase-like predicted oxidoreductase
MSTDLIAGRATTEGTQRFARSGRACLQHYRAPDGLALASISLGTRQGEPGGIDDLLYRSAVDVFLERGGNVFNTALSDRAQTSERALGTALRRAIGTGTTRRDEFVVVTKGGILVSDPTLPGASGGAAKRPYLLRTYVDSGLVDPDRVVGGSCMLQPSFIRDQIRRSRANLGLETLDYYLVQ